MSKDFDIENPVEPGLYESMSWPIYDYPNQNMPYKLFGNGGFALVNEDGEIVVNINPESKYAWGPFRKFYLPGHETDIDFDPGVSYWVTFRDGSRIRLEASEDKYGDVDIANEDLGFELWVGKKGEPMYRDHIVKIEKIEEES